MLRLTWPDVSAAAPAISYKLPARRHPVAQFILHQPLGAAGLACIVIMALAAIFAPWVTPYDPLTVDYGGMLAAPSWQHWMGTDSFGRDVMTRVIYGARTALAVGFLASFVGSTAGAVIGVMSAYFGGKIDMLIQGAMDILLSFPIIVLALVVVAMLGQNIVFGVDLNLIIAISIPMVVGFTATEKRILGCLLGSVHAQRDIPRLLALWKAGRLDLEGMITQRLPLDQTEQALESMRNREGIRTVLTVHA